MVHLLPRLKNLRVRRTWRGLYPMTPDGSPIVGWNRQVNGLLHTAGDDQLVLEEFSPCRKFESQEVLK
jgi:hypothetical protein